MDSTQQKEIIHAAIREKDNEHQRLRTLLQSHHSLNETELFALKRKIIILAHEKSFLIQQVKDFEN